MAVVDAVEDDAAKKSTVAVPELDEAAAMVPAKGICPCEKSAPTTDEAAGILPVSRRDTRAATDVVVAAVTDALSAVDPVRLPPTVVAAVAEEISGLEPDNVPEADDDAVVAPVAGCEDAATPVVELTEVTALAAA